MKLISNAIAMLASGVSLGQLSMPSLAGYETPTYGAPPFPVNGRSTRNGNAAAQKRAAVKRNNIRKMKRG